MKRINERALVLACLMLLAITASTLTGIKQNVHAEKKQNLSQADERFVPGRVLVKFHDHILPEHARNIIAALGARDAGEIPNIGVHILDLPDQANEKAFVQAFQGRAEVEFAELDRVLEPADITPNDLWYANWEWHLRTISAPTAWSTTTGSSSVTIAILDTGVDGSHPDLAAKMVSGWNVYNNNSNTSDVGTHGTGVAGTAAAISNNGIGVASVCWNCKIMPVRVSDNNGYATDSRIASGLTWAADHGARVANVSYMVSNSSTVSSGASYFQNKGGVVTVSAGNYGTFDSAQDNPYVMTVTASNATDQLYAWSNRGNNLDVCAPGEVYTTNIGSGYTSAAGTSFSAPIVAGVAALVLSVNPNLTAAQVQMILKQSADDIGSAGWDSNCGWGRVNAARAVSMASSGGGSDATLPTVSFSSPEPGANVFGSITAQVAASDNVGVTSVSLRVDGVPMGTDTVPSYSFSWDTVSVVNGMHTLTATASDAAGNSASTSITVMVNNTVDTIPPVISIVLPTDGSSVSGTASVSVNQSDNTGVIRVDLYVDGVLKATSTAAPFTTKWNTRKASVGVHKLQAKAHDAAGNVGNSPILSVYK